MITIMIMMKTIMMMMLTRMAVRGLIMVAMIISHSESHVDHSYNETMTVTMNIHCCTFSAFYVHKYIIIKMMMMMITTLWWERRWWMVEMLEMQEPTDNDQLIDISWRKARWKDLSENWSVHFQERKKNWKANYQNASDGRATVPPILFQKFWGVNV